MAGRLVNLAYFLAAIAYLPILCYQMLAQGKNRRGWGERFGHIRLRPAAQPRIWLHAVSLGEVNVTPRIVEQLATRFPYREIVVSTTTDTGYARACQLYGCDRVFRFPLDFTWVVRRVLDRVNADLIVLIELEVWHNLVRLATRRGIPVAVINGRLTQHSADRLARLGGFTRSMFADLAWVGTQDAEIAERFKRLGTPAERVAIVGSMKWDTVSDSVDGADELAAAVGIDRNRPLWVCGSTGPGEEAMILDAYRLVLDRGVRPTLAIVPRKPERFDEVARLIDRRSLPCVRRSQSSNNVPKAADAVVLGDTMGELRTFYTLATVVFVGRSLVPMGGSDPMEVAALGKPIVAGPHMENFRVPVDYLRERGALSTVSTSDELAAEVFRYCHDPACALEAGRAARAVVLQHQGATTATATALERLVATGNAACQSTRSY